MEVGEGIQKKEVRKDTSMKNLGPCHRVKGKIYTKKGKVEMTRCLPICGKRKQEGKKKKVKKVEKNKDKETLRRLVPKRFWKWKKVFRKKKLERMPVQKTWDHAIELKEEFTLEKEKVYSLSREEREEVQAFVENQLRKGYI